MKLNCIISFECFKEKIKMVQFYTNIFQDTGVGGSTLQSWINITDSNDLNYQNIHCA